MIATFLKERDGEKGEHLSHSRINRYLLCPEQYRLYYLENLRPKVPAATLVFGNIVHQALARLFLGQGDPVQHFVEMWRFLKTVPLDYGERDSWEKLNASGQALLEKFLREEFPKLNEIRAVEKPFEIRITGLCLPLVGVIDLIADLDGTRTVVDFKTASISYSEHDAALTDQLTAYRLAEPSIEQLALCALVKTKQPKIQWHLTSRTGEQLSEYVSKVRYVAGEISAGHFHKRPGIWCAWCDYLPVCMADRRKTEASLVRIQ